MKQIPKNETKVPRGYLHIGLDHTSSSEAKFGARSSQAHQIRGKTWEFLLPQDAKVGEISNFGVISEFQRANISPIFLEAKFGEFHRQILVPSP